jgi:hypothetical protein
LSFGHPCSKFPKWQKSIIFLAFSPQEECLLSLTFFLCCVVWDKRGGMKRWLAIVDILCVNLKKLDLFFIHFEMRKSDRLPVDLSGVLFQTFAH